jgi:hypothetical protein
VGGAMSLNTPKQRVIEERSELSARLGKLKSFIGTAPFLALSDRHRILLTDQSAVMSEYLRILDQQLTLMEHQ